MVTDRRLIGREHYGEGDQVDDQNRRQPMGRSYSNEEGPHWRPLDIQIEKVRVEVHMTMETLTEILGKMTEMDQIEGTQEIEVLHHESR